jgi:hypothetical protein
VAHVYLTMWQQVLPFFVIDLITSKQWRSVRVLLH